MRRVLFILLLTAWPALLHAQQAGGAGGEGGHTTGSEFLRLFDLNVERIFFFVNFNF